MSLARGAFNPLPLGAIRPTGWLRAQLEIQARGLSGHIEEVWEDLGPKSGWRGGDGESWERGPYYLDGLVPLAHVLESRELRPRAEGWLEWILASQRPDGFFGPPEPKSKWGPDWWYLTPALKALAQHAEATGDARVVPFMLRFFRHQAERLADVPLQQWARARAGETDLVLQWLHDRCGEPFLLEHLRALRARSLDWSAYFRRFPFPTVPRPFVFRHETHIVNVMMALKYPALWGLWSGLADDREAMPGGLEALDRHHGQATGVFAGDEHLNGRSPTRGCELCAVVEMMWSLVHLLRITGDARYGDRLEQVAYNALPAAFDGAMRIHQYDQQVNQVLCTEARRDWIDNGPRSNLFGLAPNFGCCAANYHQGWPKLASHLWLEAPGGLATTALAPCTVTATIDGREVTVVEETRYPFGELVAFTVRSREPVALTLHLRIPAWCEEASIDGHAVPAGGYVPVTRLFEDGARVLLRLPRRVRSERRHRQALSLYAGPLLLALPIPHRLRLLPGESGPFGDHEVLPEGPWSYALETDEDAARGLVLEDLEWHGSPYTKDAPPLRVRIDGRRVPGWDLVNDSAGPAPESPVRTREPLEALELVPYGATMLRLAEVPTTGEAKHGASG